MIHQPGSGDSRVVTRLGYSNGTAWALQNLFPLNYEIGFTDRLDPVDHLPPSISDIGADLREQFVRTPLFRRYLSTEGYRDGMSLELFDESEYLGLVHFSARQSGTFQPAQRALAQSLSGLLALGLRSHAARQSTAETVHLRWTAGTPCPSTQESVPLLKDPNFIMVVAEFLESPLDTLRYIWHFDGSWVRVTLSRRSENDDLAVTAQKVTREDLWQLRLQELRVLSGLVIGRTDTEIATALTLSKRTINTHMANIRRKMGVGRRAEAAARAATASIFIPGASTAPIRDLARVFNRVR
ncbi:helix-turn-helix transcriptional regulator [Nesterenkonia sp. DZ6]|uniref:helix-turn-helix transcriptional regulator n=1 Tax=Nesterenkonia sp. DZ6 TaxID=2901229 RepID=UPI001F4CA8B2|nr:LuxR C-terminal-related transcriptional regulator [Nesterenkonia sp. DZ6]